MLRPVSLTTAVPADSPYRLAPCFLLATLLHIAVLLWFQPRFPAAAHRVSSFTVELAPAPQTVFREPAPLPRSKNIRRERQTTAGSAGIHAGQHTAPLDTAQLIDSARSFARDDEKKSLQKEKQLAATPAGRIGKEMQQAGTETRLANGMLKITTPAGTTYCLQPPPHFVQNTSAAALYNIPVTCP